MKKVLFQALLLVACLSLRAQSEATMNTIKYSVGDSATIFPPNEYHTVVTYEQNGVRKQVRCSYVVCEKDSSTLVYEGYFIVKGVVKENIITSYKMPTKNMVFIKRENF